MSAPDRYVVELSEITGLHTSEIRRRLGDGGISLTGEQSQALQEREAERERSRFYAAAEEGDFETALSWLGSTSVASGIIYLDEMYGFTAEQARDLLREHWTRCDAPGDATESLLDLFQLAGYVSDCDERPTGELTVYRGTFGDDPCLGISWTLDKSKAEWFAEHGARGAGLAAAESAVWRGTVNATAILGYFVERKEAEVILDPTTVRDVTLLQEKED